MPMRTKSLATLLVLFMSMGMGQLHGSSELLQASIDIETMSKIDEISVTKRKVSTGEVEYLFVTRSYGFGRDMREVYLYELMETHWSLVAFARTGCAKPELTHIKNDFEVFCGKRSVLKLMRGIGVRRAEPR